MDDFTSADLGDDGDDLTAMLQALFGAPDPAALREHYLGHLRDDLGLDDETAGRLLAIDEMASPGFTEMDTEDKVLRAALHQFTKSALDGLFNAIHHAEGIGAPIDSVIDCEVVAERATTLLAVWDRVNGAVADATTVEVPDDISSLTT